MTGMYAGGSCSGSVGPPRPDPVLCSLTGRTPIGRNDNSVPELDRTSPRPGPSQLFTGKEISTQGFILEQSNSKHMFRGHWYADYGTPRHQATFLQGFARHNYAPCSSDGGPPAPGRVRPICRVMSAGGGRPPPGIMV